MATVVVIFEGDDSIHPDMLWGTVRDLLTSNDPGNSPSLEGVAYRMAIVQDEEN